MKAWDGKHHHVGADLCMFRYHGEVSAALVLGGVDLTSLICMRYACHTACLLHTHVQFSSLSQFEVEFFETFV